MSKVYDPDISHEVVLSRYQYDASTGLLYWRVSRGGTKAGSIASIPDRGRYMLVSVGGRRIAAHRLIWFYVYGVWPKEYIDHIDGNGLNNRLENLRQASKGQNSHNRKYGNNFSGFRGVYKVHRKEINNKCNSVKRIWKPWCAKIMVDFKTIHLGNFDTKEEAIEARKSAEIKLFKEFAWKDAE